MKSGLEGGSMILFKACPKCRGDLSVEQDKHGEYVNCVQCGFLKDVGLLPRGAKSGIAQKPQGKAAEEEAA